MTEPTTGRVSSDCLDALCGTCDACRTLGVEPGADSFTEVRRVRSREGVVRVTSEGRSPSRSQCGCVWRDERCPNEATQEDGLCNWCGNGRTPEQMMDDPKALILPDGTFMGIGGAGQLHDSDRSKPASTAACWYPDSDRTIEKVGG